MRVIAEAVMEDSIGSASEYITVPGNTVESYVDGLLENFVETTSMSKEDIILLKKYLLESAQREIEENQ